MQKNTIISCLFVVCSLSLPLTAEDQRPAKPNVVLMFVDDLGWQDVGHLHEDQGHVENQTQNEADGQVACCFESDILQAESLCARSLTMRCVDAIG